MKRAFTHKVEYFPSYAADNNALAKLSGGKLPGELANTVKANSPEVNRRACTSAAMIGLAISMGASSLLLPNQSDEAIAAEPMAGEPTTTSTASETAVELPTSTAELQPAVSNLQAEAFQAAIPDQAPTVIEHHVQADQLQLAPTSKVDEASLTTSNSFSAKSVPPTQVPRISSVGSIVKLPAGDRQQFTQLDKVNSPQFQPSSPTQISPQLQAGQSVNFPSTVNDLLKATQEEVIAQLRHRSSNDQAQLKFEESTNKLATPKIARREFSVSLKPLTTKEAVQVQQPAVQGLETSVNSPFAVNNSLTSPKKLVSPTMMPLLATTSNRVVMPVSLPATSVTSPVLIAPVAEKSSNATDFQTTISATPAVPKPVVIEPQQRIAKTTVYQVRPGDTVEEIAEAYTVTPKQLVRSNKIDNPNLIKINQQLRIPPVNSISLVSQIQPTSVNESLATHSELLNTRINQAFPTGVVPAVLKQPLSSTRSFSATATLVSTVAGNAVPQPTLLVAKESNSEDSSSNSQLKQQSQSVVSTLLNNNQPQQPSVPQLIQANLKGQTTLASATLPASRPLNSGNLQQPESLQAQAIQANSKSYTPAPIVIEVPKPLSNSEVREPVKVQQASPSVSTVQPATGAIEIQVPLPQVATAPTEPSNYNPNIQTPIGDTVSPDLPAIQSPTPYLPPSNPPAFQGFIWPAKGVFTSGYGRRWGRMHKGIDVAAPIGTPIVAVAPGIVRRSGWNSGGYGNLVEIQHPDGSFTRYAHNSRLWVVAGQEVQQGQQIAEMGSTGHSTGPHLHFELHAYGKGAVNPIAYLQRRAS
ncbi:Peptidase M23 [Crinalium epipsammum PCC 9333]|uniref:Peptidase M23 n=1 Tax=Crinalium epipsammum PCC 9333 TaxID=1173022 RepID=K9VWA2_9CYAN|nr:peptidoglycan DD-metalloendopeptidase family protein [Crinalium epipsammum]AFZ12251.1 Peptidase M23 [Crinalium epipsammum PCC 9333]